MQNSLEDSFGRRFAYLRLSITDACNFRCVYCLPNGYEKPKNGAPPLSISEIENLATAFSEMGMWKVRLTGGEPTLRRDLSEIALRLGNIPGIRKIALSTNGYRLKELAPELLRSGITAVNVSVDTLDEKHFEKITGSPNLKHILDGIETALSLGFESVKVNAVLLKGWNEDELSRFQEWIKTRRVAVRFIELMPTEKGVSLFRERHLKSTVLSDRLSKTGWQKAARGPADGPADEWSHPDYLGKMGFIAPYAKEFCTNCNRLRVTSTGALRLCLFAEGGHSLRPLLQEPSQKEELQALIRSLLNQKEVSHYLPLGKFGDNHSFSEMGG